MKPITPVSYGLPNWRARPSGRGSAPCQATKTGNHREDCAEISEEALGFSEAAQAGRTDRVTQLRAAVHSDTYVTADKIEWVVDRLLDELAE
jgi:hypothetical protein